MSSRGVKNEGLFYGLALQHSYLFDIILFKTFQLDIYKLIYEHLADNGYYPLHAVET